MRTAYSEEARRNAEKGLEDKKRLEPDICDVCKFIKEEGWTGLHEASHCRQCHAIYGGSMMHCVQCHRTFSTSGVNDRHQYTKRDPVTKELEIFCLVPENVKSNKRHVFAEPIPNAHGTPVYHLRQAASRPTHWRTKARNPVSGT